MKGCLFPGCEKNRQDMQSYKKCNKCHCSVGVICVAYCSEHYYGADPETGCRFMPPYEWSCIECYPDDFYNWKLYEKYGIPKDEWINYCVSEAERKRKIEFRRQTMKVYYTFVMKDASYEEICEYIKSFK